jgi:hypothetical protein
VLAFAGTCVLASIYGFLQGAWPFGVVEGVWSLVAFRRCGWATMILISTITCPSCGIAKVETMPTDACQFFYKCTGCGAMLKPKPGDCCVFCSYGDVPCPPIQEAGKTGSRSCC